MYGIFTYIYPYQLVQDFVHQQYIYILIHVGKYTNRMDPMRPKTKKERIVFQASICKGVGC